MKHLDLFSGSGAFTIAAGRAGFDTVAFAEIDRFASTVLRHHWPETPNVGDVTELDGSWFDSELITAGSPCQDFSIAGLRAGVSGERSGLILEPLRIAEEMEARGHGPRWILLENVPGILNSGGGRDLAHVLGAYVGAAVSVPSGGWASAGVVCGPSGVASYRVLDAQYFGVPQRRLRFFCLVERHPRDWPCSLEVLLEPEGVHRRTPTRRQAGEGVARPLGSSPEGGSGRNDADTADNLIVAPALTARESKGTDSDAATTLVMVPFAEVADPIATNQLNTYTREGTHNFRMSNVAHSAAGVRRLTPRECERLQGLDDDHTLVVYRKRKALDGARYRTIGNGVAVPVVEWILYRLNAARSREERRTGT